METSEMKQTSTSSVEEMPGMEAMERRDKETGEMHSPADFVQVISII